MEVKAIGSFVRTHGVKGQVILMEQNDFEVQGLQAFFIDTSTGKEPYFIEEMRDAEQGLIVKLEGIDSVEAAKKILKKTVYVDAKFYIEEEEQLTYVGYTLHDAALGALGVITAGSNNGVQDLVSLQYNGKEVILPIVPEFIEKIDEAAKLIYYKAPEGLIEIYLE